ncbi:MAG: nucleotidyl transferase AbiEii/AbiGii toxin family protein [Actinomycetota bacterium]
MSNREPTDISASVKQRLLNLQRRTGEPFDLILLQYASERFLYRLTKSRFSDRFVLKGAMLLIHWIDKPHRPTRDVDMLGFVENSAAAISVAIKDILGTHVQEDGLVFDTSSVQVEPIREEAEYGGMRAKLKCCLGKATITLQVDIGFGDAPGRLEEITLRPMLDQPAPVMRAYPMETVIAEKFHAMVEKGIANSRMKDFIDVWLLSQEFDFAGKSLAEAIEATFKSRGLSLPIENPVALTDEFSSDTDKIAQMRSFIADKTNLKGASAELAEIVDELRDFLMPVVGAILDGSAEHMTWTAGGPWKKTT